MRYAVWNLIYSSHRESKGQSVLIIAKEGGVHKQDLAAPDVTFLRASLVKGSGNETK